MDDIYVYFVHLPRHIREMVAPCLSGYTVYIDKDLTHEQQQSAYLHALRHIKRKDFEKSDVQVIESEAHSGN